jgi:hypothetical protein
MSEPQGLMRLEELGKFKNLHKIFGPKRDELTGVWRELQKEELRNAYPLPSIIRTIKLKRMRWMAL